MHCSALRGHIRPSVTRRVNIQYMGFHLRNSFQERIACLAIFQIYHSFICLMKHIRFMLFKKAKTGFFENRSRCFCQTIFSWTHLQKLHWKKFHPFLNFPFKSRFKSNCSLDSVLFSELSIYGFALQDVHSVLSQYVPLRLCDPFFMPEKPTAFLRKCDSILSQQTQPNNATPARYCCGFPSIGLHPFLIHTLIRKVRDTLQDLPFPTTWKGFFQSFPPSENHSFKRSLPAFLFRTFKSVSLSRFSFCQIPLCSFPVLRFLSVSPFPLCFSPLVPLSPSGKRTAEKVFKAKWKKEQILLRKRTFRKLPQPSFFLWVPASFSLPFLWF